MREDLVNQIVQLLLETHAQRQTIEERPPLELLDIAPYPAAFLQKASALFGIHLNQDHLHKTIAELADHIRANRING